MSERVAAPTGTGPIKTLGHPFGGTTVQRFDLTNLGEQSAVRAIASGTHLSCPIGPDSMAFANTLTSK